MKTPELLAVNYQQPDDFYKIRKFICEFYQTHKLASWTIDRLNFALSISCTLNKTSFTEWQSKVRWWQVNGEIQALVMTEGENRGESFLMLHDQPSEELLDQAFEFIIDKTTKIDQENGTAKNILCINNYEALCQPWLERYGFTKTEHQECESAKPLVAPLQYQLPKGYRMISGGDINRRTLGIAHAEAFGYREKEHFNVDLNELAFTRLLEMPDYRHELDLCVIDKTQRICAFATFWYDELNQLVILEPLGVVPETRRLGLATAVLSEGLNRAITLGAKTACVGNDLPVYRALGFEVVNRYNLYRRNYLS